MEVLVVLYLVILLFSVEHVEKEKNVNGESAKNFEC